MTLSVAMVQHMFYPSIGGAQTHTLRVSQKLRERGIDAFVITRHYAGLAHYEEVGGVPVYRVGKGDAGKAIAAGTFIAGGIQRLYALRKRFDLIHCHQMISPMTISLIARGMLRKPLIINPHLSGPRGDVGILTTRRPVSGKLRLKAAQRYADAFISISRDIQQELQGAGIDPRRIHLIPNGVDPETFHPVSTAEQAILRQQLQLPDGPLVVFVGRLAKVKGLDVLLEAWPRVVQQQPTATLVLVGEGDQREALRQQIQRVGIGKHVVLAGGTDDSAPYLQAANAFVLPSRAEGMPVALLEAMASGLPCVASAVGGSVQLLQDGVSGRLVPAEHPEALAQALLAALDGSQAQTWGKAARQSILDHFSLDAVAEQYIQLYESLLSNRAQRQTTKTPQQV